MLKTRFRRDDGQTMAEYAVVLGVITAGILGGLAALSTAARNEFLRVLHIISGLPGA
ncbi:MAG TPA: hypothetical protein VM290_03795 [Gaiellaceae bacterium]|jgi:Flp pilus assembly pilin Flp|nr:hypothetical protein [Gaiellaceae bacterium]